MYSNLKYVLPILWVILLTADGWGQLYQMSRDEGKDKFQVFGFQVTHHANQDQKLTDQVYHGYGGGIHAGELTYKNDQYKQFQFAGGYERLWSPHEYVTDQAWGILQYRHLFLLSVAGGSQWYAGPYADVLAQMRITNSLGNNSFNWDVSGGLGPSFHWNYDLENLFAWEGWRLYSDLDFHLISYVFRPNYALPVLPPETGISFIGKMIRYRWDAGIQFPASRVNTNQYRIWYRWDLIRHRDNEVQTITAARHFIGFSYLFNTHNSLSDDEK